MQWLFRNTLEFLHQGIVYSCSVSDVSSVIKKILPFIGRQLGSLGTNYYSYKMAFTLLLI